MAVRELLLICLRVWLKLIGIDLPDDVPTAA